MHERIEGLECVAVRQLHDAAGLLCAGSKRSVQCSSQSVSVEFTMYISHRQSSLDCEGRSDGRFGDLQTCLANEPGLHARSELRCVAGGRTILYCLPPVALVRGRAGAGGRPTAGRVGVQYYSYSSSALLQYCTVTFSGADHGELAFGRGLSRA